MKAAHDPIEARVDNAQAVMVLARHRASNWLGTLMAAVICWALWNDVDHALLLGWLAVKALVGAWRIAITWRFDHDSPDRAQHWANRFDWALAADGLVFGMLGTLLLPRQNPVLAALMIATLLGIASVALVVLSMRLRSALSMVLPTLAPAMLMQFTDGQRVSIYIGAGIAVFLFLVLYEGGKASTHTRDMLRLRFEMDEVAAQRAAALDLAERNSAVKDRFLATMSHEMRTPLHGILGLVRMLQERGSGGAQAPPDTLRLLERTGEHLLGVINDVLDFSKMQAGRLSLARQSFDLAALVEAVADVARVQATEKGLHVDCDIDIERPCWVSSDPTRLRQILLNLTSNAVKFTAQGSCRLRIWRDPGGAFVFDVVDTGPGVPADQRDAIFDAFHQADNSDRRRHGGTGLGLTISRELAQMMGGTLLCLDHEGPGAAFRFSVALPAARAPASSSSRASAVASGGQTRLAGHVLLVEDNPINALVAEAVLRHLGLEVERAADGQQAVDRCRAQSYDLILMDCQMPVLDGFQATRRIREIEHDAARPPAPIVALTANALEGDRERSLAAGMNDHLTKPFREEEVLGILRQHLGPAAEAAA